MAITRRTYGEPAVFMPVIRFGELELDILQRRVRVDGHDLHLTPLELSLLYLLAANAGRVLTRDEILDHLWGGDHVAESNVVDRHVRNLRAKLRDDWRRPRYIATIPGQGYRFVRVAAADAPAAALRRWPHDENFMTRQALPDTLWTVDSGRAARLDRAAATHGEETATMANETIVVIKNFAYSPDPVEIPVGGAVTWINRDTVPHTATAQDREVLQSGTLIPGDRFSQTFNVPGAVDYFCEFHANMKGTVIVQ